MVSVSLGPLARAVVVSVSLCLMLATMALASSTSARNAALAHQATVLNGPVTGSAFMLYDGIVVTNAHVLTRLGPGDRVTLIGAGGGRRTQAVVIARSARMDLALLQVSPGFLPTVGNGRPDMRQGTDLVAAGVDAAAGARRRPGTVSGTITSGVRHLAPFGPGIVARMPGIRRGFSGGPVFDANGRLVGMVAAMRSGGSAAGNDAFILTASEIRREARRILTGS
jgi:S1-C subfamily serine protease